MNTCNVSVRWLLKIFVFASVVFTHNIAVGMAEVAEKSVVEGLSSAAEEAGIASAAEAMDAAAAEVLSSDLSKVAEMSPELQTSLQGEVTKALGEVSQKLENGEITSVEQFNAELQSSLETARSSFAESLPEVDITVGDKTVLDGFSFSESELDAVSRANVVDVAPSEDPLFGQANQAGIEVENARAEIGEEFPGSEGWEAAEASYEKALSDYYSSLEEAAGGLDRAASDAEGTLNSAASATQAAEESGEASGVTEAGANEEQATAEKNDAKKDKEQNTNKTLRDAKDVAKKDYATKKQSYKEAKTVNEELKSASKKADKAGVQTRVDFLDTEISDLETKIESLKSDIEETSKLNPGKKAYKEYKLEEAQNELKVKKAAKEALTDENGAALTPDAIKADGGPLSKSDTALGDALKAKKAAKENYLNAYKKTIDETTLWGNIKNKDFKTVGWKGYEKIKTTGLTSVEQMIGGVMFGVGAAAFSAAQTAWNNSTLRKELQNVAQFGNIYMRIPDALINSKDPSNSAFIYVGINVPEGEEDSANDYGDQANNQQDLQAANLYASYNQYGNWGGASIGSSTFPDEMVHLNTGYRFVGNGEPADLEKPIEDYYAPSAGAQSVVGEDEILSGIAYAGATGEEAPFILASEETGYEGSPTISNLLNPDMNKDANPYTDDYAFPQALQAAINTLRGGIEFGGFNLAEIRPLSDAQLTTLSNAGVIDVASYAKINSMPYASTGLYVYQTYDTDLVRSGALKGTGLPDLVVVTDDLNSIVELHGAEPGTDGTPTLGLNPDVKKVYSILNGMTYDDAGAASGKQTIMAATNFSVLAPQIQALQTYVAEKEKYGPFKRGTVQLETTKDWADNEIPVYKISQALSLRDSSGSVVQVDDYVIPIAMTSSGPTAVMLPETVSYLLSLVTSQFYTSDYVPVDTTATYYIIKDSSNNITISTSPPSGDATLLLTGSAPFATLFMDSDINPNQISDAQRSQVQQQYNVDITNWLPVPTQWALTKFAPANEDGETLSGVITTKGQTSLLNAINTAHTTWKGLYIENMDESRAVASEVGPFKYFMVGTVPVFIAATSLQDVVQGIYVYESDYYPDQYLIISSNTTGASMEQYNPASPQRYLISLSSGVVFDSVNAGRQAADSSGTTLQVDPVAALKNLSTIAQNQELYDAIDASQTMYKDSLAQGATKYFGKFTLFLSPADQANGHYIYADVSALKDPVSLYTAGTLLDSVNDFFVFSDDMIQAGSLVFGKPLTNNTQTAVSLVSGEVYDRSGYRGRYESNQVVPMDYEGLTTYMQTDILGYQTNLLAMVKTQGQLQTGKAIDIRSALTSRIGTLTESLYNIILAEKQEFDQAAQERARQYPPLDAGAANLEAASYMSDDVLGPRYIKFYTPTGKYYFVSPQVPDSGGIKYIDYNAGTANGVPFAMLYDQNGEPVERFDDPYLAAITSQRNGVYVATGGSETLGVPIDHPGIPVSNMVELDATTLQSVLTTAETNYKTAYQALQDGLDGSGDMTTLQTNVKTAAAALGRARLEYQSALAVQAQASQISQSASSGYSFTFYMNEDVGHYYVLVTTSDDSYYIDLTSGLMYSTDGSPRFMKNQVFVNLYAPQDELFYEFSTVDVQPSSVESQSTQDPTDPTLSLLGLVYKGPGSSLLPTGTDIELTGTEAEALYSGSDTYKTYNQMDGPTKVRNEFLITSFYPGVTYDANGSERVVRYELSPTETRYVTYTDEDGESVTEPAPYSDLRVYQNDPTYAASGGKITQFATYEFFTNPLDGSTTELFTGSYVPEDGVYSMVPVYYQTRTGTDVSFTDSSKFARDSVVLIWDGSPDLNLQRMIYNGEMLDLSGGPTTYTAGTVSVTIQKDPVSLGQYVTITDGGLSYDFILNSDVAGIAAKKQDAWGLNVIPDALGQNRLVNKLPTTLSSVSVSSDFIDAAQFSASGTIQNQRQSVVTTNLSRVKYDATDQRYVFKFNSKYDTGEVYFQPTWNGWQADLRSGVLYDLFNYPQLALSVDQLYALLDSLEFNVVDGPDGAPKLSYRTACNVALEAGVTGIGCD